MASQSLKTSMRQIPTTIYTKTRLELPHCGISSFMSCAVEETKPGLCYPGKGEPIKAEDTGLYLTQHVKDLTVILPFRV